MAHVDCVLCNQQIASTIDRVGIIFPDRRGAWRWYMVRRLGMKLVGGKDYYDNALGYGQDDSVVFRREKNRALSDHEIECVTGVVYVPLVGKRTYAEPRFGHTYEMFSRDLETTLIARITVIFCGKIHRGVIVEQDGTTTCYWQADKFKEWLAAIGHEFNAKSKPLSSRFHDTATGDLSKLFHSETASNRLLDWLAVNQVVTAIRFPARPASPSSPTWEINSDRLKDVEFYRVMNSFEAFQEIEMWVGGILPRASDVNLASIDDDTRRAKHGFDQMSFRRPKKRA